MTAWRCKKLAVAVAVVICEDVTAAGPGGFTWADRISEPDQITAR